MAAITVNWVTHTHLWQISSKGFFLSFSLTLTYILQYMSWLLSRLILLSCPPSAWRFIPPRVFMNAPPPPPPHPPILSLPLAKGRLSANVQFYFCNLHPLWQPSVSLYPTPTLQTWLLLCPDHRKSSYTSWRVKAVWAAAQGELDVKTMQQFNMG